MQNKKPVGSFSDPVHGEVQIFTKQGESPEHARIRVKGRHRHDDGPEDILAVPSLFGGNDVVFKTGNETPRVIIAPAAAGKTFFCKTWGSSLKGKLIDSDEFSDLQRIYAYMTEQFGQHWWSNNEACQEKDRTVLTWIQHQQKELFLPGRIIITAEPMFGMPPAVEKLVVIPPFDEHEQNMARRAEDRNNTAPVLYGTKLDELRTWYYKLAQAFGSPVYRNFVDAYWAMEKK